MALAVSPADERAFLAVMLLIFAACALGLAALFSGEGLYEPPEMIGN